MMNEKQYAKIVKVLNFDELNKNLKAIRLNVKYHDMSGFSAIDFNGMKVHKPEDRCTVNWINEKYTQHQIEFFDTQEFAKFLLENKALDTLDFIEIFKEMFKEN